MVFRKDFETRDPELAVPVIGEFYPDVRMSNPDDQFSLSLASADAEKFELVRFRLISPGSSSSTDLSGSLTVGMVENGDLDLSTEREAIDTTQPWLYPQQTVNGLWDELAMNSISLSIPETLRFARTYLGDDHFKLRFSGTAPIDLARGRQWGALAAYLSEWLTQQDVGVLPEIVRANAYAHLVATLLATFPNNLMEAEDRREPWVVAPSTVRRAVEFIESNAHLPITVEQIAHESRLSVRGLQYAFRAALDTTPIAYLRRVRLAGAHRALLAADPRGGATVSSIALEWGFAHAGRFSELYRDTYGTSPRQTLNG